MRVRDWAVALSVAAVLGVLLGSVYSGVTGWTGPSGRVSAGAASGLPVPGEWVSSPQPPERAATRSASVPTAATAARPGRAKPPKSVQPVTPAKDKAAKEKPGKPGNKGRPGRDGD